MYYVVYIKCRTQKSAINHWKKCTKVPCFLSVINIYQIFMSKSMVLIKFFSRKSSKIPHVCNFIKSVNSIFTIYAGNAAFWCFSALLHNTYYVVFSVLPHNTYYVVFNPSFVNGFSLNEINSLRHRRFPDCSWRKSAGFREKEKSEAYGYW